MNVTCSCLLACTPFEGQGCPYPPALTRYGFCLTSGGRRETVEGVSTLEGPGPTLMSLHSTPCYMLSPSFFLSFCGPEDSQGRAPPLALSAHPFGVEGLEVKVVQGRAPD